MKVIITIVIKKFHELKKLVQLKKNNGELRISMRLFMS